MDREAHPIAPARLKALLDVPGRSEYVRR